MRKAGKLAAKVLDFIAPHVQAGISTLALNDLCHDFIVQNHAIPATVGYKGYTKATCISLNHVICHGIPSATQILREGDILNIDVTVIVDGWHGDTSRMYTVGKIPKRAELLIDTCYQCLMRSIDLVKPGIRLGDVGSLIQQIAESKGFSVVRDFCGHGIGKQFHAPPEVPHFGQKGTGVVLEEGMFFTIEPMINAGRWEARILADGWTAVTKDQSLSAQWEHTIGVTKDGAEIFTPPSIIY